MRKREPPSIRKNPHTSATEGIIRFRLFDLSRLYFNKASDTVAIAVKNGNIVRGTAAIRLKPRLSLSPSGETAAFHAKAALSL